MGSVINRHKIFGRVPAQHFKQIIKRQNFRTAHAAFSFERERHAVMVARGPELRLPVPVVVPFDHLPGGQYSLNSTLTPEVESLERSQIKDQISARYPFHFPALLTSPLDALVSQHPGGCFGNSLETAAGFIVGQPQPQGWPSPAYLLHEGQRRSPRGLKYI